MNPDLLLPFVEIDDSPENGGGEVVEVALEEELLPELLLRTKTRDVTISLRYLNKVGAKETSILKNTVLINTHGSVKMYSRVSVGFLDISMPLRQHLIWLVDWK